MLPCHPCRRGLPSGLCLLACTGPVAFWQPMQAGAQVSSAAGHFWIEHTLKLGCPVLLFVQGLTHPQGWDPPFCQAVGPSCLLQGLPRVFSAWRPESPVQLPHSSIHPHQRTIQQSHAHEVQWALLPCCMRIELGHKLHCTAVCISNQASAWLVLCLPLLCPHASL